MSKKVLKKSIIKGMLTLAFEKIDKVLVIDLSKFTKENREEAAEHGYLQRFGDLESGDEVGHAKYEACVELRDHYLAAGDWRMTAGSRDTTAIVIEAMTRLNPKKYPKEKLEKAAAAKPEQVKLWRADLRVKNEIAKIYAERAEAKLKDAPKEEIAVEM